MELAETHRGNSCLVMGGYSYRKKRCNKNDSIVWQCLKEKRGCKGKLVIQNEEVKSEVQHTCVPDEAEGDVRIAVTKARKRAREECKTPISQIFREELQPLQNKGLELVSEIPQYRNIKNCLYKRRKKALGGVVQEPTHSNDIILNNDLMKIQMIAHFYWRMLMEMTEL